MCGFNVKGVQQWGGERPLLDNKLTHNHSKLPR